MNKAVTGIHAFGRYFEVGECGVLKIDQEYIDTVWEDYNESFLSELHYIIEYTNGEDMVIHHSKVDWVGTSKADL